MISACEDARAESVGVDGGEAWLCREGPWKHLNIGVVVLWEGLLRLTLFIRCWIRFGECLMVSKVKSDVYMVLMYPPMAHRSPYGIRYWMFGVFAYLYGIWSSMRRPVVFIWCLILCTICVTVFYLSHVTLRQTIYTPEEHYSKYGKREKNSMSFSGFRVEWHAVFFQPSRFLWEKEKTTKEKWKQERKKR